MSVAQRRLFITKCMALTLCLSMIFGEVLAPVAMAAPGDMLNNSEVIPFSQAFFAFEVESPVESLKGTPIWDELEQLLDDPYLYTPASDLPPNTQGFGSYRSTIQRRRSFLPPGCTYQTPLPAGLVACDDALLGQFVVHPLNYNHMTGEELRLVNPGFLGAPWAVPDRLVLCNSTDPADQPLPAGCADTVTVVRPPELGGDVTTGPFSPDRAYWIYKPIDVSPGVGRVEVGESAPDFNSPIEPDTERCIVATEMIVIGNQPPREGITVCGGDPGEPNYSGFGVLNNEGYSTPAVPNSTKASTVGLQLYDPERGFITPRNETTGVGGLRKPSLRVPPLGTPGDPGYAVNSEESLAADPSILHSSNENDYFRGVTRVQKATARHEAEALGKALFWDMQVGSDAVQACGSCHFHAGADNRTKNQLNPNHLGGDFNIEVHGPSANQEVTASDFPLHKLADPEVINEGTLCGFPGLPPCPPGLIRDTNDVMSSMGVVFSPFSNIRPIGAASFGMPDAFGVRTLLPDLRTPAAVDPIPVFQGLRRVEPRNTPTLFATAMNFDNFWDGRARHDFNGGSVFGPTDPQSHVFVCTSPNAAGTGCTGNFVATRQIIRFASIASLATGPALSNFEMSFDRRNWAKIGKKLLQGNLVAGRLVGTVTPLANQLVSTTDSVLGIYSNQGGSACRSLPSYDRSPGVSAPGKPGLCISYPGLIRRAFYPHLWATTNRHLNGCYTDGDTALHPNQCALGSVAIPVFNGTSVVDSEADPFDNYILTIANGAPAATNTNQFSQMEANMPLFFGLSIHAWVTMLVPDNTGFDQFMDENPDSFLTFGEANEPTLAFDLLRCDQTGGQQPCFTEVGNFKRDTDVTARINCGLAEGCPVPPAQIVPSGGTRTPGSPDPLMGLDFFLGSNLSLKNPNFMSMRCGECHAGGTLTDHTFDISHQTSFGDFIQEFITNTPGIEVFPEPLGRGRVITGFALEGELQENAQDAVERNVADFCVVEPCMDSFGTPIPGGVNDGFPQAQALFDNGVYNIGVRPIMDDFGRGGPDPFGWPLSLSVLALKNLGGVDYNPGGEDPGDGFNDPTPPGIPLPTFDPEAGAGCAGMDADYLASHVACNTGGLFEETAQDQQINPGFGEEPANPLLPPYLSPWASNLNVGDEINQDELFIGLNTLMFEPMLEGFVDTFGPFNPAATIGEAMNSADGRQMATWPAVNKVNRMGAFKAPPLRNVELTGPFFHVGSKLTLRQELDFYDRGGDFPLTNHAHRDFLIVKLDEEDEALGGCKDPDTNRPLACTDPAAVPMFTEAQKEEIKVAVIDFLLELTDSRVKFEQAPFDHPEIFVPLDGTAPDNGSLAGAAAAGRPGFMNNLANGMFRQVPAVGAGGVVTQLPNFLGISSGPRLVGPAANCDVVNNHYCH